MAKFYFMRRLTLISFGFCGLLACNSTDRTSHAAPSPGPQSAPAGVAGMTQVAYVRFEDPVEHAFAIEVPQGWNVKGGLYRLGYFDARIMAETTSPDGQTVIRVGDVGIPPYSLPDRSHPTEGVSVTLPAQAQITIAKYRTGPEFAVRYAQQRFHGECSRLELVGDVAAVPVKFNLPPQPGVTQETEGQAAFRCTSAGQGDKFAFVYAKTSLTEGHGPAIWNVTGLLSILTPEDRAADARNIALHSAQSLQINPQWIAYQDQMNREGEAFAQALARRKMQALSAQVQQFRARMQAMSDQVAGFERHQAAQAQQVQGFTDALNGVTRTYDPLTGQNRTVWSGQSDTYWVNGLGQVISSNTAPPGFHQLQTAK